MFRPSLSDARTVESELQAKAKWISKTISDLRTEIASLSRVLSDRESLIGQQNFDLLETYKRYTTLSDNQCERELTKILDSTEAGILADRLSTATIHRSKVDVKAQSVSSKIDAIEKLAVLTERYNVKLSAVRSEVDTRLDRDLQEIKRTHLQQIKKDTQRLIDSQVLDLKERNVADLVTQTGQLQSENAEREAAVEKLKGEWTALNDRIAELMRAIQLLESHITVASQQRPLPALEFQSFDIANHLPVGRRNPGAFGNLLVLAPIHSLGRRFLNERPKFFAPRQKLPSTRPSE
jgi:chromosome segregation ATPase